MAERLPLQGQAVMLAVGGQRLRAFGKRLARCAAAGQRRCMLGNLGDDARPAVLALHRRRRAPGRASSGIEAPDTVALFSVPAFQQLRISAVAGRCRR